MSARAEHQPTAACGGRTDGRPSLPSAGAAFDARPCGQGLTMLSNFEHSQHCNQHGECHKLKLLPELLQGINHTDCSAVQ